jgi:hypothetical protein
MTKALNQGRRTSGSAAMRATTVDELYDREIRELSLPDRLHLARRILNEAAAGEATAESRPRSLLELEGLGAELWSGLDAQDYVSRLRREWDGRS